MKDQTAPAGEMRALYALMLWRAICEEAECIIITGEKRLMLTEEMCTRLGAALEATARLAD